VRWLHPTPGAVGAQRPGVRRERQAGQATLGDCGVRLCRWGGARSRGLGSEARSRRPDKAYAFLAIQLFYNVLILRRLYRARGGQRAEARA